MADETGLTRIRNQALCNQDGDGVNVIDHALSVQSKFVDSTGKELLLEENSAMPVNIQDQHTRAFDLFFSEVTSAPTTLLNNAVIDLWHIDVTTGHGFSVGEQIVLYDVDEGRLYIGTALTVGVNTIELDTPLNFSYQSISAVVLGSEKELNVDGSVTRRTFSVSPPITVEIDITRIMFLMKTIEFPELDMFGDIIGGLARGIVFRVVNGINVNYFNVKTNGDLALLMYDIKEYEAAKHGINGLGGRLTYAGPSKHGVTIRLEQGDTLEVIIQDDLTSLSFLRMMAVGHVVGN